MKQQKGSRILLERLANTRDLGGYQTIDGKMIAVHKLIRSGALFGASASDCETLKREYGLKLIVDFRTAAERQQQPDPHLEGVTNFHLPILNEKVMGITREQELGKDPLKMLFEQLEQRQETAEYYMQRMYHNLVFEESARAQYRQFFQILLTHQEGAVLWHCSAGKDRVGVGTALLLSALGVDEDTIMADYLMTQDYLQQELRQIMNGLTEKAMNQQQLSEVECLFGVKRAYLASAFDAVGNEFGNMGNYLSERLGIDSEQQKQLKEKYLL